MTEEQKKEEISFLYRQLDTCGQILAEWDDDKPPTYYNREYKRIMKRLEKLEPDKWDFPCFQKRDYTKRNENIEKFCSEHQCPKCGGKIKQTRSGSLRVVCVECGTKFQVKTKKN